MTGFIVIAKRDDLAQTFRVLAELEREIPHLLGSVDGRVIRLQEEPSKEDSSIRFGM